MQNRESFRAIWDGDSETDCVEVCRDLMRAGIEYRVAQQPISRSIGLRVDFRYTVGVLDSDYKAARAALGFTEGVEDEIRDQAFEIPESVGPTSEFSRSDEERRAHSYLEPWHPGDATVEVWSQVASSTPTIVELALKENLIRYRLGNPENGRRKLLVLPEDEPRAREIVREIHLGEPPK